MYLIVGRLDLLPSANNIPNGKQNIRQKNDTIKVNERPPQAPVSTQVKPNDPPDIR